MIARLFARKSIEALTQDAGALESGSALPRTLSLFSLTCFGVGSTIGAGIFVLTGTVAAERAGPAVVLSFVLASFACALAGLCYAEFAGMVPVAGSAYTYAYATLGELVAWIIGWCLILEYLFASALVAIGWSGYAVSMAADFGVILSPAFTQAPLDVTAAGLVFTGAVINLPAVAVVVLCTGLLLAGTRLSARVNDIIVVAKVAVILVVGIAGLLYANGNHWSPMIPTNSGHFGDFGISGVVTGAAIVFYAYVGFDAVSTMAQETHNPRRNVPLALIASLAICTALYVLVALMITGLADYRSLNVPDPVYVAIAQAGPALAWAKPLIGAVVVVGLISALLVTLLGQVRIFYAMARDGLLPKLFMAVHPRWRTPYLGTLVTGVTTAVIAGLFPLQLLGELISIGTLLAFAIVCLGVIVLRQRRPDLPRPFRVPGYPFVPLAGIIICIALMLSLPPDTWLRLAIWLILGFVVYAVYGVRHSQLRKSLPRADV
ncbi:amino acid permease [Pseudolysobacter antarcticus]|uniref:Amino acid permease n=1 Tax=Pseudolysobacter antarcticus TaxID=2511995 RepID=A0A411HH14_9GAMM|nr:amino acid permease [Pseudolysobacter antarcticus]QBB69707.1 amino acid permease [Pseudolysobacter antarcticus]